MTKPEIQNIVNGVYACPRSDKCHPHATSGVIMIGSMSGNASTGDQVESLCQHLSDMTGAVVDWHTYAGRYVVKCDETQNDRVRDAFSQVFPELLDALPEHEFLVHAEFPKMQVSWLSPDNVLEESVSRTVE